MSHVDPVLVPIPRKWLEDPEIGPFMDYMMRFWHDLWFRSGAGDDSLGDIPFYLNTFTNLAEAIEELLTEVRVKNTQESDDYARRYSLLMS